MIDLELGQGGRKRQVVWVRQIDMQEGSKSHNICISTRNIETESEGNRLSNQVLSNLLLDTWVQQIVVKKNDRKKWYNQNAVLFSLVVEPVLGTLRIDLGRVNKGALSTGDNKDKIFLKCILL